MRLTNAIRNNRFDAALLIVVKLGKKYKSWNGVKPVYKWDFKRKEKIQTATDFS